jgi:hypothetical protein
VAFVALYSMLPHKEVRFLFPVLPLFNTAAAAAIARLHLNRAKALPWSVAYATCVAALLASAAATTVFMQASRCVPAPCPEPVSHAHEWTRGCSAADFATSCQHHRPPS